MIIIPDLFTPYIEGKETARKANWNDLNNYNQVQKGQLDNLEKLFTFSPRVNREYESTDALALANIFKEADFQNALLRSAYQTANTQRQAQGIGLRSGRAGAAVGQPGVAAPAAAGKQNPAGAIPKPGLGKAVPAAPQPNPAAPTLATNHASSNQRERIRQEWLARGATTPTSTSYLVNPNKTGFVEDLSAIPVNVGELQKLPVLNFGKSPLSAAQETVLQEQGISPLAIYNTPEDEFVNYDTSGWSPEYMQGVRGLQVGQGLRGNGILTYRDDRGFHVAPVGEDGTARNTHFLNLQVQ